MNRIICCTVAVIGMVVSTHAAEPENGEQLDVVRVRPNFYMIAGAGANIGFQVGADGVVVVDSGSAASADAVVAAIKKITTQPIRYVINTSADPGIGCVIRPAMVARKIPSRRQPSGRMEAGRGIA